MNGKLSIAALSLLVLLSSTAIAQTINGVFDVRKYGAKPNVGITQALSRAWLEACASGSPSKVVIPQGIYKLGEVTLKGPCKAPIELNVQGTLKAPASPSLFKGESWVTLQYIDQFTLSGTGTFDAQGNIAWAQNNCAKNSNCAKLPISLRLNFLTNSTIQDITSLNSKNFHVNVLGCKNVTFQHFTITAPENSINTDGIHIGRSDGINIIDSTIKTGDDCISLGDGSRGITVTRVTCGPGHGISVGSLGKYPNEEPVSGVFVKNCTLTNTTNGVRIKTWPASYEGSASDMHFEDIIMVNVANPVLIDQVYCPYNQCKAQIPSRIKISNVSFKNIRGSSSTAEVVKLACSKALPCENVEISDIKLTYSGNRGPAITTCTNVKPTILGVHIPPACGSN